MIGKTHNKPSVTQEWLTPPWIIDDLGPFDLDPCAAVTQPIHLKCAMHNYTKLQDGLNREWFGRVWLNPPYDHDKMWNWIHKLYKHGDGIALIFARTDTDGFFKFVWDKADALLFLKGRLFFYHPDGTQAKENAGGPSVLVAYGRKNANRLYLSNIIGKYIGLK